MGEGEARLRLGTVWPGGGGGLQGRQGRISEHASSLEALALFCLGNIIVWD